MFFIVSKILSFLIHPFSWILLFLFIAWRTKRERLKKWLFRSAIIMTLFFSNTVIFCEFTRLWEKVGQSIEEVQHHDIAIVLGGMAEYDNNHDRLSLRRGGDRIWQALHLYHLGQIDKLLLVGANGHLLDNGLDEANQFKSVLVDFGIPETDILVEDQSKNTYQNAVEAKKIIDADPTINSYLLITSAIHMRRSLACFEKAGFKDMDYFTTDHYTGEERGYTFEQYLIPNISVMSDWGKLNHEWVGYLSYWFAGYV